MRITQLNRWKWLEMVLGLLPASMLVGPLLPIGLFLVVVTLGFSLATGVNALKSSDGTLQTFLSIFGAAAGLWGLWFVWLFGPAQIRARRVLHSLITLSLIAGLASDSYWFRQIASDSDPHWYVKPVWFGVLVGPLILGMKYLFLLLRGPALPSSSAQNTLQAD
jgi:hypothetical protein